MSVTSGETGRGVVPTGVRRRRTPRLLGLAAIVAVVATLVATNIQDDAEPRSAPQSTDSQDSAAGPTPPGSAQSTGPQSTGPQSTGPQSAGSQSTGPPGSGSPSSLSAESSRPPRVFPGAATTGVPPGTKLKKSGPRKITKARTIIDRLDVAGSILIDAPNVVIRRSRIRGTGGYGIRVLSGSVHVEDTEISGFENGIAFDNWSALRVNVHSVSQDGFKLGSDVVLADSWCHELTPSAGAHADCAQMQNGVVNTVVRGNHLDPSNGDSLGNAALFLRPSLGPSDKGPLTVTGNLFGGGNYSLFCVDGNPFLVDNIEISDNTFKRNFRYGPHTINVPVIYRDNVWADTGEPVEP